MLRAVHAWRAVWVLAGLGGLAGISAGCTDGTATPLRAPVEAPPRDAGAEDAAPPEDAALEDAALEDAALEDAGSEDAGAEDDDAGSDERGGPAEHCAATLDWPESYAEDERALLDAIALLRSEGFRCGDRQLTGRAPLTLSPALQCSARLHSKDMVERDFTGRTNPDGDGPRTRMRRAGFAVDESDEAIVAGERSAMSALADLLADWDDCNTVGTRGLTHVGIGRYEDRWTLDFAREARGEGDD